MGKIEPTKMTWLPKFNLHGLVGRAFVILTSRTYVDVGPTCIAEVKDSFEVLDFFKASFFFPVAWIDEFSVRIVFMLTKK